MWKSRPGHCGVPEGPGVGTDWVDDHYNFAVVLAGQKRLGEAIVQYQKALELKPDFFEARHNLAVLLIETGQFDQAVEQFQKVLFGQAGPCQRLRRPGIGTGR